MKLRKFESLLLCCLLIGGVGFAQDSTLDQTDPMRVMQAHLDAVAGKDLNGLMETLAPNGKMQLILPGSEIIYTAGAFVDFHEEWFKDLSWTFEPKILNAAIGDKLAAFTTEVMYREPLREGKPYFNRMIVTYVLEKANGKWYVISDHASSVEKSTDE